MRLRVVKAVEDIKDPPITVLKESEGHQYQFFSKDNTFLGKSPCRGSIKKLTPEDAFNRSDLCGVDYWDHCNLVDGWGNVLDTITHHRASVNRYKNIRRQIGG